MLLRRFDEDDGGATDEVVDEETESGEEEEKAVLCAECGHEISSHRHKFSKDGGFEHSFVNPAGIMYRVGCFREAPGVGPTGRESDEFSWFDGYTWQVVVCKDCMTHLGWSYWSDEDSFYGLILPRLDNV